MKRYISPLLVILCFMFIFSTPIQASISLMLGEIRTQEIDQTLEVNVVLNSDQLIEKTVFEYWWDQQIHTYPLPEGTVPDSPVRIQVILPQSELPSDQIIYFRLTAKDTSGDTYVWNDTYYDWNQIPLQQLESEHVIFTYKSLDDHVAHQFLQMAEEAYQSIATILHTDCPEKIRFYFLHSYEQLYAEYEYGIGYFGGFYDGKSTVLVFANRSILSSKHTIIHEFVHAFQYAALYPFTLENKPPASQWFDDIMCNYVTMKAMYEGVNINQYLVGTDTSEIHTRTINPNWRYDEKLAILFFNYLFAKYDTNDVTEAVHQFVASSDFQSNKLPSDFISYLAAQYQIDLDLADVGRNSHTMRMPHPHDGYSYLPQSDQVVYMFHHLFHRDEKLAYDIALYDPQTKLGRDLTSTKYAEIKPHLAPDGKTVFFIQQYGDQYAIVNMNLENQEYKRLYISKNPIFDIAVSPDGKTIAFAQLPDLTEINLWVLRVSDGTVKQLTTGSVDSSLFFRTNNRLYFISRQGNERGIYFIDLPTQQAYLLPNTSNVASLIDVQGNWCLYQATSPYTGLYLFDITNCTSRQIMSENDFRQVWFPRLTEDHLFYFEGGQPEFLTPKRIPLT